MSGPAPAAHWTVERIELMRRLRFVEGVSASKIAAALSQTGHKFTRNAVIAKCDRLGWTNPAPDRVSRSLIKKRADRIRKLAAPAKPKSAPKLVAAPIAKPSAPLRGPNSIRHKDRTWHQCPMFCAGEEGADGFVCGNPMEFPRETFCSACKGFAFQPLPLAQRRVA